jgi:hypothetical protein
MAKTQRREQSTRTHQSIKAAEAAKAKRRKINWTQIFIIVIGLVIVASMILSLLVVPGQGF